MFVDYAARGAAFKAAVAAIAARSQASPDRTPAEEAEPMTAIARDLAPSPEPAPITLKREQHQPDYVFLVAVIGLVAIGILMVYSSSAMTSFLSDDDQFKAVGPQVHLGGARPHRRWPS